MRRNPSKNQLPCLQPFFSLEFFYTVLYITRVDAQSMYRCFADHSALISLIQPILPINNFQKRMKHLHHCHQKLLSLKDLRHRVILLLGLMSIPVLGMAQNLPLTVSPSSLQQSLEFAQTGSQTLSLENTSNAPLDLSLEVSNALVPNLGGGQANNPLFDPSQALEGRMLFEEDFENGFPSDWERFSFDFGGIGWRLVSDQPIPNYAGSGDAAYLSLGITYDYELRTPAIPVGDVERGILRFRMNFQTNDDPPPFIQGSLFIEISNDEGNTWELLLFSSGGIGENRMGPGALLSFDITPYLNENVDNVIIRWRNVNPQDRFAGDAYIQIDEVRLFEPNWFQVGLNEVTIGAGETVEIPANFSAHYLEGGSYSANLKITDLSNSNASLDIPISLNVSSSASIQVSPLSLQATLANRQTSNQILKISNIGGTPLEYSLNEPIPNLNDLQDFERFSLGSLEFDARSAGFATGDQDDFVDEWFASSNWVVDDQNPLSGDKYLKIRGAGLAGSEVLFNRPDTLYLSFDVQFTSPEAGCIFEGWIPNGFDATALQLQKVTNGGWQVSRINNSDDQLGDPIPLDVETPTGYFNILIINDESQDLLKIYFDNTLVFQDAATRFSQFLVKRLDQDMSQGIDLDNVLLSSQPPVRRFYRPSVRNGEVAPGESQEVSIELSGADLPVGNYFNELIVNSNDPGSADTISLNLEVAEGEGSFVLYGLNDFKWRELLTIEDGAQINLLDFPDITFSIRAIPEDEELYRSVLFEVSGEQNFNRMDNYSPFSLFGDGGISVFFAWRDIGPGHYTFQVTPYPETDNGGTAGLSFSVSFEIVEEYQPVLGFLVIDPQDGTILDTIQDQDVLDLNQYGSHEIAIEASVSLPTGSVHFELNGPDSRTQPGTIPPFLLYGQTSSKDIRPWKPRIGNYTLQAYAFSERFERGFVSDTLTVSFSVENNAMFNYSLIDAQADTPLQSLTEGQVIDLGQLGTTQLNIEAISSNQVGSVAFELQGPSPGKGLENNLPYAVFGDNGGDFNPWSPAPGDYTLITKAYNSGWATGALLTSDTLHFSISSSSTGNGQAAVQISLYPNPNSEEIIVEMPEQSGTLRLTLKDASGKILLDKSFGESKEARLAVPESFQGVYLLQVQQGKQSSLHRVLID